jgi:hypothetical protein
MLIFLFFIIFFIGIISFLYKNSRIFDYLLIFLIGIIFSFNRDNHDYLGYVNIFNGDDVYGEAGYLFLIEIIKFLGFDHRFIVFIVGLFVTLTFVRLRRHTKNIGLILVCYAFFPLINDIIQIRNTIMTFLLINSILDYTEGKRFRSICLYIMSVSFHTLGAVFIFPWLLTLFFSKKIWFKPLLIIITTTLILLALSVGLPSQVISFGRISNYLPDDVKFLNFFFFGVIFVDLILIRYYISKIDSVSCYSLEKINFLYSFFFASIVLLPGILIINHFFRVFAILFIVKYFLVSILIKYLTFSAFSPIIIIFFISSVAKMISVVWWIPRIKETRSTTKFEGMRSVKHIFREFKPTLIEEAHQLASLEKYLVDEKK